VSDDTRPAGAANAAAFFDLDRTLISGSSAFDFGIAAWRNDMIPTGEVLSDALNALTFKLVGATDERSEAVRDRILHAVEGAAQDDLLALNEEIIPRILEKVRPESRGLIEMHHEAGRETWIVSASPIELVAPLAKALGMPGGIGTTSAVDDGHVIGARALIADRKFGPERERVMRRSPRRGCEDLTRGGGVSVQVGTVPGRAASLGLGFFGHAGCRGQQTCQHQSSSEQQQFTHRKSPPSRLHKGATIHT
jgi:phosphoserine phosphatase